MCSGSGSSDYFEGGSRKRFRVDVDGVTPGVHTVFLGGVDVGQISTDDRGRGRLEFDTADGTWPQGFPDVFVGDVVDVGGRVSGAFFLNCS